MKKSIFWLLLFSFGLIYSAPAMAANSTQPEYLSLSEIEKIVTGESEALIALEKELNQQRDLLTAKKTSFSDLQKKWNTLTSQEKESLVIRFHKEHPSIKLKNTNNYKEEADRSSSFNERVNERRTSFQQRMAEIRAKRQKTSGNDTSNDTANVRGKTSRYSRNIEKLNQKTLSRYGRYQNKPKNSSAQNKYQSYRYQDFVNEK